MVDVGDDIGISVETTMAIGARAIEEETIK